MRRLCGLGLATDAKSDLTNRPEDKRSDLRATLSPRISTEDGALTCTVVLLLGRQATNTIPATTTSVVRNLKGAHRWSVGWRNLPIPWSRSQCRFGSFQHLQPPHLPCLSPPAIC